ncbi:uncharacterized protein LOC119975096 isoform X2 [Scyliorhinus canicula]|uniref:uncharacterized protein LOC119975096 isoform X2 n=1 Tax=Scyliorhinus canicula TaxID=7830 RepID=UPI0018F57479|nr:uncharacterized protein LOC119975096 isoform X2 [Scyliorhinus canicula]
MSHLVPLPVPCPIQLGTVKADTSGSQLHQFVREGNHTKVKKVLKKGAAVDTRNSLGQTPLFVAALLDLVKVVDVLLEFGANPNHRCEDRSTPVHAAAFSCNQWILSKLLDAGGDLRLNDKDGRIPRTWAKSAGKEHSIRILEFMQRCASHMQGITQQVICSNSRQVGCSSQALIRNPSILNKITSGNKEEFLSIPKAKSISSQSIQCFGFGKFCVYGPAQLAYLASIPIVNEKELVQADDEPTFSYANGPHTTMTNLTWNGIRVTVKHMNLPTHQNCSKRLPTDLLIAEQEYNSQLRHPNFLLLMAVCQMSDLDQIRLVYERINLGSLYGVLHERRSEFPVLLVQTIIQMLLQIIDGVLYLHSRGYIHRVITSHAVQLVLPGIAKLSNFEFMVESVDGGVHSNLSRFPIPPQFYNWLAPEVIRDKPATIKSDVYSVCTLIQELFTDAVPWEDLDGFALKELIATGRYLTVDEQVPQPYYDIVRTGIQIKPQNRTMNLQDIRFILRNDIKKHTFEDVQSELGNVYDDISSSDSIGFRREQEQLQEENARKGRKPEYLEEAQITAENDCSYYNLGRRTSFSPNKDSEPADKVRGFNTEPSQQIMVLYDSWKTEQNQPEGTTGSRIQSKVYDKVKLSNSPWNKLEQSFCTELVETQPSKRDADVLEHLHDLDLALEQEMYDTSDNQPADDDLETGLLYRDCTEENSEGDSSMCLETATEYGADEEDELSDGTPSEFQKWSGVEDLASDQEKQSPISSRALTRRALEEATNTATSLSIQHSISSCAINIQTSKHLVQQAFSALDHIERGHNSEVNMAQKAAEEAHMHDVQLLDVTSHTKLPDFDEVDYQRKCENGNRSKPCSEGHLVIPLAVAPPRCYQLPVYEVEKRHGTDPVGHIQPVSNVLSWTQGDHRPEVKDFSSGVLKTSDTFADGTQTTCLLRKQVNDEESDNSSALERGFTSLSEHVGTMAAKSKKKTNVLKHAHHQDTFPARKGRISMRIPAEGIRQEYRKQCMYLSGNRKIRISQSCNIVPEGMKVKRKKTPEVAPLAIREKTRHQNFVKKTNLKSGQTLETNNWTNEVTEMIEKMTYGCLPAAQGEPKDNGSPRTNEEELFRRFAKLPWQNVEHHQPYSRHHRNSKERKGLELRHQQMQCSSRKNSPEKTLVESDSSVDVEEIFRSFAGGSPDGTSGVEAVSCDSCPAIWISVGGRLEGQSESFDSQLSGCSEEEIEVTNMDKTFITRRVRKKAQKEKAQHSSMSDSSLSVSDEFFTPNPETVSLGSETSTNADLNLNQHSKESTSFEEELEISRAIYRKNTTSLRSSSSSDTDDVVEGKKVSRKVTVRRRKDGDRSSGNKLSSLPSSGSFFDIQDISCIPCDGHFTNHLLLSKTPSSTLAPIDNSTPYSLNTGKSVPSGQRQNYTGYEPMVLQTKILETSLWPSRDSSAISPGTFATACDETNKMQTPITTLESQCTTTVGSITSSTICVVNASSEPVSEQPRAIPPSYPAPLTGAIAGHGDEVKLTEPGTPSGTMTRGKVTAMSAGGSASCDSQCSPLVSEAGEEAIGIPGEWDKNKQNQEERVNQMPEGITSGDIVQKSAADQRKDKIVPKRQQEVNRGMLEHHSDWERCSIQKSMEETERAHSTLDSVLEEMLELQDQTKEKITKVWTSGNNAHAEEASSVSQKEECYGKQTNILTIQGTSEGALDNRTPGTGSSVAPESSLTEESSNRNQIGRADWNQPHRVIILE